MSRNEEFLYRVEIAYCPPEEMLKEEWREIYFEDKDFKQLRSAVKYAYKKAFLEPWPETKGSQGEVTLHVLGDDAIWHHPHHEEEFECLRYMEFQFKWPHGDDCKIPEWYLEEVKEQLCTK